MHTRARARDAELRSQRGFIMSSNWVETLRDARLTTAASRNSTRKEQRRADPVRIHCRECTFAEHVVASVSSHRSLSIQESPSFGRPRSADRCRPIASFRGFDHLGDPPARSIKIAFVRPAKASIFIEKSGNSPRFFLGDVLARLPGIVSINL